MYKQFLETNGKTPMSHYELGRSICLAKIDPLGHGSCKQRGSIAFQRGDHRGKPRKYSSKRSAPSVASTASVSFKRQKAASVTCKRLEDLSHGFQATRLDHGLCHLSVPAVGKKPNCAMCRWATGNQYRAQVSYCEACEVNLCVWCYKNFHTVERLGEEKEEICAGILARKGVTK